MAFSKWMSVCGLIGSVAVGSITGCSSDKPAAPPAVAGQGGTPSIGAVDNPGSGGRVAAGSGGAGASGTAGALAAGAGGGGTGGSTAGAGGSTAGAGGSAAAGSGGTDGGVDGDAAVDAGPAEDDPFGGLFGPVPTSCDGLLCLEDADCATLYPDETATCKLTRCVDFACK